MSREKKHSLESKAKISETMKGTREKEKNPQFGTCWIFHDNFGNKKCKLEELSSFLESGWRRGRRIKQFKT
jgi:hypothetical protein